MRLALIVAMDENRVIGRDNRMPWRLPADLRRFRALTMGQPIIMGRRTHESIGRPLPGRRNIVLTHDPDYRADGCLVVYSLEQALAAARPAGDAMIIGGAALYAAGLPLADRLYLTLIHARFEGDVRFPEVDWSRWRELDRTDALRDEDSGLRYRFIDYARRHGDDEPPAAPPVAGGPP